MAGKPAADIAAESFVSIATIRSQIKAILRKLEVNSQLAAVAIAYQLRLEPAFAQSHPCAQVAPASCPFLDGDRVADVVLPPSVDLQVALGDALVAQAELLDHPPAGPVAGHDRDLHPVQGQVLEGVAAQHDDRLGAVAVAGLRLVHPVADVAALEGAPLHRGQVDLARRAPCRRRSRTRSRCRAGAPAGGHRAAGHERVVAVGRVGLARPCGPAPTPSATRRCACAPRRVLPEVRRHQRAQRHAPTAEQRHAGGGPSPRAARRARRAAGDVARPAPCGP